MTHFCTLFNKSYLHYGVALYNSIENNSNGDFHLFVLAMDEDTFDFLNTNSFNKITCISLNDFEDDDLKLVKLKRSFGEYCWTCTPSLIKFCLEKFKIPECIYLDADLYFYSDPSIGWKEMPENYSIFLTEHNYHPKHDKRFYNGMYCVQYVGFRNNVSGLNALNWWKQSCLNWCYAKYENGKFGDQKYLDD